jgi:hypothetical protein
VIIKEGNGMTSMETYAIYRAGSARIGTIYATCISKAARQFIATLERQAKYELDSREQASIRYTDNHCVMSDFVVIMLTR